MSQNSALRLGNWFTAKMVVAGRFALHDHPLVGKPLVVNQLLPRLIAGSVLLTASMLKCYSLFLGNTRSADKGMPLWTGGILVSVELLLAVCLLLGLSRTLARSATLTLFTAFAVYSLRAFLEGRPSCGCFGQLVTSPRLVLVIDVLVWALLYWWRTTLPAAVVVMAEIGPCPPTAHRRPTSSPAILVLIPCLALGLPAGWMTFAFSRQAIGMEGAIIVVEPEKWLDRAFPLVAQIDIGQELLDGKWIVLFYHHDCPKCQDAVAKYEQNSTRSTPSMHRVALIEVPPWQPDLPLAGGECRHGRLDDSHDWFMETPTHLLLVDGVVRAVSAEAIDATRSGQMSQGQSPLNQPSNL